MLTRRGLARLALGTFPFVLLRPSVSMGLHTVNYDPMRHTPSAAIQMGNPARSRR